MKKGDINMPTKRTLLFILISAMIFCSGCGNSADKSTTATQENTVKVSQTEADQKTSENKIPSYYNPDAFNNFTYINPKEADFQITDTLENINTQYGTPWCWKSQEENISVQMYLQEDKTLFLVQKEDGEYLLTGAKDSKNNDSKDRGVSIDCYDLTGDGNKELVICYPRYIGGTGSWNYAVLVMNLQTNKEIPVFINGSKYTDFTSQQAEQINEVVQRWNKDGNNEFSWWKPLAGEAKSTSTEVDVFQPSIRHYENHDAIVVGMMRDPLHNDPVGIDVKLIYKDGSFQVDNMAVTSWRRFKK